MTRVRHYAGHVAFILLAAGCCSAATGVAPQFRARRDYPLFSEYLTVADVNGDGFPDLISTSANDIQVLLGNHEGVFQPGPTSSVGYETLHGAVADLNGDGKVDVLTACISLKGSPSPQGLCVSFGNGDGTFQAPVFYEISHAVHTNFFFVVTGDFNNDGKTDVAVLGASGVWLLTGKGDGTLNAPHLTPIKFRDSFHMMVAGDFNSDGNLDLVVNDQLHFFVLLGDGKGSFTQKRYAPPAPIGWIATGDLNGDGHFDIALAGEPNVYVYFGDGKGDFSPPSTVILPCAAAACDIAIGDLNGDHVPDIANATGYVAAGNGDGTFGAPVLHPVASDPGCWNVVLADLRNNGMTDIVVDTASNLISVLLNKGQGRFEDGEHMAVTGGGNCAADGDFNLDGKPDMAVASTQGVTILLGTGHASPPFAIAPNSIKEVGCPVVGDLNGDGIPDLLVQQFTSDAGSGTIYAYLGKGDGSFTLAGSTEISTFMGNLAVGDFNKDGKLDFALANNWMSLGNGDGTFEAPFHYIPDLIYGPTEGIAVGDFNGDGWPDILVNCYSDAEHYHVLLNDQNGQFTDTAYPGGSLFTVALADLNGDGILDFVASTVLGPYVGIQLGDGKGGFVPAESIKFGGIGAGLVTLSDVNGDGIPDLEFMEGNTLAICLGNGDATFGPPVYIGAGSIPAFPFFEALRGQAAGLPDIVVPDASNTMWVLYNQAGR